MIPHLPHHEVWTGVEGVASWALNFHTPTPLLGVGGVVWRGKSGEVRCGNGRGHGVENGMSGAPAGPVRCRRRAGAMQPLGGYAKVLPFWGARPRGATAA